MASWPDHLPSRNQKRFCGLWRAGKSLRLSPLKVASSGSPAFSLCRRNRRKWLVINGVPGGIRTPNLLIRSQKLYPVELQAHAVKNRVQSVNAVSGQVVAGAC